MTAGKLRVLVIDDNEDIGNMVKTMLQLKGYEVAIKTDAVDVEDIVTKLLPGLIIMDMLLSGADGREVCKKLKANAVTAPVPVLMISAHPTARKDCTEAGADFFLEKPFDMKELLFTVENSLQREKG